MSAESNVPEYVSSPKLRLELTPRSANFMPCRACGEGALGYDANLGCSRCRVCGSTE